MFLEYKQIALAFAIARTVLSSQEPLGTDITASRRPNVVFILTDDQDVHLSSLDFMPLVRKHMLEQGTYFGNHYCTTAVCCPSRVTLWTGKAAHNTNITDVNPPYGNWKIIYWPPFPPEKSLSDGPLLLGGYPKFVAQGFNDKYLPVWLQEAGYNTYYTGKLFNYHTIDNYNSPEAAGFTDSVGYKQARIQVRAVLIVAGLSARPIYI